MDESWRMRMGMPTFQFHRRPAVEDPSAGPTRHSFGDFETLEATDFADVFGGPPRSVLSRKISGDFSRSASFYEEIFRPPEFVASSGKGGRSLPAFRIPAKGEGFYSDIFGSDEERRRSSRERSRPNSKAKSKSNSSSVLSSEELSPLRPVIGDDVALSSFASKLRPINVPCRWNSTTLMPEERPKTQKMPAFPCNRPPYVENQKTENDNNENFRGSYCGFSRRVSSPETISIEPNSYRSIKISADDLELNSPSSPVSSLCQEPEVKAGIRRYAMEEQEMEQEEDEVMSSYVIEINSDYREGTGEAVSIDEAIAWAKEKFQSSSERRHETSQSAGTEERTNSGEILDGQMDGSGAMQSPMEAERKTWTTEEEKEQSEKDVEMEQLDEDIRLWSSGRETNIRLLLSTLHHILWAYSGWHSVPLTSLIESSQVKKAYQKARLCLHPDKLQQRGATIPQKYVADKAFSILQDAWAAFISQDVFFN